MSAAANRIIDGAKATSCSLRAQSETLANTCQPCLIMVGLSSPDFVPSVTVPGATDGQDKPSHGGKRAPNQLKHFPARIKAR